MENTPTIETDRLILRRFTREDTEDYLRIMSDEEVNTFLPWFPVKTVEEANTQMEELFLKHYGKSSAYRYAICLKADNRPIGYVDVGEGDSYDFGYGLRKEFWHKGIVTEASVAVVERLKHAGFLYITATHDMKNERSGEVMKKLGMTYRYTYIEQCQPKDISVTFHMYQLNFDGNEERVYMKYWNESPKHWIK